MVVIQSGVDVAVEPVHLPGFEAVDRYSVWDAAPCPGSGTDGAQPGMTLGLSLDRLSAELGESRRGLEFVPVIDKETAFVFIGGAVSPSLAGHWILDRR